MKPKMIKREPIRIPRLVTGSAIVLLGTFVFEGIPFFHGGITNGTWESKALPGGVESLRALSGIICLFYLFYCGLLTGRTNTLPVVKSNIYAVILFLLAMFWLVAKIHSDFSSNGTVAVQVAEILFPTYLIGYMLLAYLSQGKQAETEEED